ncbi:MAG: DNA translocase FtsK [Candidatus Pacebacteria bacterium]|nr:DNA translocase FtsK [Candidatus Paceibacterota bacterium]
MKKKPIKKKKYIKKERTSIKKERTKRFVFPTKTKKSIGGILMFLLAVLIGLSFFEIEGRNLAGNVGAFFMRGAQWLFGYVVFSIPLILIIGGVIFFNTKYKKYLAPAFLAILLLIFGLTGLLGILDPAQALGGRIGLILSWLFLGAFDFWASSIIFSVVILIGLIIIWHFALREKKEKKEKKEQKIIEQINEKDVSEEPIVKELFTSESQVKKIEPKIFLPEKTEEEKEKEKEKEQVLLSPPSPVEFKIKSVDAAETIRSFIESKDYQFPPLKFFESERGSPTIGDIKINSAIIQRTLQNFDIQVEMVGVNIGPTVTQYSLKPAEGVKLSKITALSNDLALSLALHPIRIEAPIPGKSLVGVEVPNKGRTWVRLRNLFEHSLFQNSLSPLIIPLGRDVAANPVFADLTKMPHLLVAGSTGSGKTISLNSMVLSLLFQNSPETLRIILVDPKRVEFPIYNDLPHLLVPVVLTAEKTIGVLRWLIEEMERRFDVLSSVKAKNIITYNEIAIKQKQEIMPYIVVFIDELADLMAAKPREIEGCVVRLAQMARAAGIHLVVATQRPSVEVITGLIKANITSRIAFQTASQVDSRTILDIAGAEKLLGAGDMLFMSAETSKPKRIQSVFVSDKEIKKVVRFIKANQSQEKPSEDENELNSSIQESLEKKESVNFSYEDDDPLYGQAKGLVIEAKKASASLLQRRLRVGYARAARLIDMLEEKGVVGPAEGAKPREVYEDIE